MADFVAVLKKTLDGMGDTTPAMRARVYDKARSTIAAKLAALNPQPPAAVAERQTKSLEDAIAIVEAEFHPPVVEDDPLAELENVFTSIARNKDQPAYTRAAPAPEPRSPVTPVAPPPAADPIPAYTPQQREPLPDFSASDDDEAQDGEGDNNFGDAAANNGDPFANTRQKPRKRISGGLIAAALAVVVVGAGGYALWSNRDAFVGSGSDTAAETPPPTNEAATPPPANGGQAAQAPASDEPGKFTQRMTADGKEVDPGPASGSNTVGEGTSVAALTQPAPATPPATPETAPATPATPATPAEGTPATTTPAAGENAPVAVGQKAIFYEERTNVAQGSAEPGSVVWTVVQESPGGDLPPEPAIRAEATIPGKDIQLRMTIRRNADKTLPASHILEMIFLTPQGFDGGGIENILRVAMKSSEQDAGNSLLGIPAKIADGFFLVALNDTKAEVDANLNLLRRQSWIDVPVVYKSGRRALFTLEKGIPGDKVFEDAMKAWQAKEAG
ncbi:hypothetical protein N7E70_006235 [Aminobacter sp. NyZ550]|jgi:hypothetical protein|uniref:Uncharacterized protein n=1 Tax=Aminobacter aminovorans TaxID=83263 RepID=A0AAC8YL22_AMIAI|nr:MULTISPECIES: hypothetical protein [Aminobacter]AMS40312.1 hypothetical protein AA2016_1378 [Aminobacter aminovorans]MBB3708159.1 hypothetical protein [Aminobacter aminovorans]WAX96459.1 hypothetical protein N7E70_006235 [Aminobacter sp. NyZ550]WMC96502.1 hypothetical protein RAR13_24605 [Aminobacter aminovorans]BBD40088.1 hypothetical protein Amn_49680 [Aminobacter sp. SS-2016]